MTQEQFLEKVREMLEHAREQIQADCDKRIDALERQIQILSWQVE